MNEVTTFIKASPVLVSFAPVKGGQLLALPFFVVDLYDGMTSKRLYVNYTFGGRVGDKVKFETDLGHLKLKLFNSLNTGGPKVLASIMGGASAETVRETIVRAMWDNVANTKLIIAYPRALGDDAVFYEALGLKVPPTDVAPMTLSELGITVNPPFKDLPYE